MEGHLGHVSSGVLPARILVIDDELPVNQELTDAFRNHGYAVEQCFNSDSGLTEVGDSRFDLILLSSDLPEEGGWRLLTELRRSRSTPVIFMAGDRSSCVAAFRLGVDDFVTKPVQSLELVMRAAAVLRRTQPNQTRDVLEGYLKLGPLVLGRADRSVIFGQQRITLTAIQFRLLWCLAEHHNQVLSKSHLHQWVLEKCYCRDDRSIDMHLSRVRRKLLDAGMAADALQTLRGRGYRLVLLPEAEQPPPQKTLA